MERQDAIVAYRYRLDRRVTRIGAAVLGLLAVGLFAGMVSQDPETVAVQNVVRTQRLELTNADGQVVAVLAAAEQTEGVVTAYHDNGLKAWQVRIRDNQYEGRYVGWNQRGIKFEEGDYQNGSQHGLWRFWRAGYDSSYLRSQGAYANGAKTGIWTTWYSADQKESEGEWRNEFMVGPWTYWNEDGSIDEELTGFYENGVKVR